MERDSKNNFVGTLFNISESALSIAAGVVKDADEPVIPIDSALNAATFAMENAQAVADIASSTLKHADTIVSVGSFVVENAETVANVGSFAVRNAETIVEVAGVASDIGGALLC